MSEIIKVTVKLPSERDPGFLMRVAEANQLLKRLETSQPDPDQELSQEDVQRINQEFNDLLFEIANFLKEYIEVEPVSFRFQNQRIYRFFPQRLPEELDAIDFDPLFGNLSMDNLGSFNEDEELPQKGNYIANGSFTKLVNIHPKVALYQLSHDRFWQILAEFQPMAPTSKKTES